MPIDWIKCIFFHLDFHVFLFKIIFDLLNIFEVLFGIETIFDHPVSELALFWKDILLKFIPIPFEL
jgi:hypothetical protein